MGDGIWDMGYVIWVMNMNMNMNMDGSPYTVGLTDWQDHWQDRFHVHVAHTCHHLSGLHTRLRRLQRSRQHLTRHGLVIAQSLSKGNVRATVTFHTQRGGERRRPWRGKFPGNQQVPAPAGCLPCHVSKQEYDLYQQPLFCKLTDFLCCANRTRSKFRQYETHYQSGTRGRVGVRRQVYHWYTFYHSALPTI
jgi:hypothetical protein